MRARGPRSDNFCTFCFTKEGVCDGNHQLSACSRFFAINASERLEFLRQQRRCSRCFRKVRGFQNTHGNNSDLICTDCAPLNKTRKSGHSINRDDDASLMGVSLFTRPSFSRTCPVWISHVSDPTRKIEGLAIIDEQSSFSLVAEEVAAQLRVPSGECPNVSFALTTIEKSRSNKRSRLIGGLRIQAYRDNQGMKQINPCVESLKIPGAIEEVASPQEVEDIAGFEDLAENFHKKPKWKTLLLLGRDNLWVHETKERRTAGSGTDQIDAVSTPSVGRYWGRNRHPGRLLGRSAS